MLWEEGGVAMGMEEDGMLAGLSKRLRGWDGRTIWSIRVGVGRLRIVPV